MERRYVKRQREEEICGEEVCEEAELGEEVCEEAEGRGGLWRGGLWRGRVVRGGM